MLDLKVIRDHPEAVKAGARKKHLPVDREVDRLLELDERRRKMVFEREELKAQQNAAGKEIARLEGDEKAAQIKSMQEIASRGRELEKQVGELDAQLAELQLLIPNLPAPDVPEGESDRENVEIKRWGTPPEFDFPFKDHLTLGEELDIIDFKRAARLSGSRMYLLKNEGALLELAVLHYTMHRLVEKGFTPMLVPCLVRRDALVGTAYFPGGEDQTYKCERDPLYLAGTSEVPVTSYHTGEILSEDALPKLYAGYSTCFRREAGAAGQDTKGLYRIHQFNKVEQVIVCKNDEDESKRFHQFILQNAEELLQSMDLPYRVVNVCGGDLGAGQVQKFDIETWMPSRGGYGETHSASRFYDFQARRLGLRYRDQNGKVRMCHTLNNTAIASPRILISILENHQTASGDVKIPAVLRPLMGGREVIEPKG